jgi:hypothetical protein
VSLKHGGLAEAVIWFGSSFFLIPRHRRIFSQKTARIFIQRLNKSAIRMIQDTILASRNGVVCLTL